VLQAPHQTALAFEFRRWVVDNWDGVSAAAGFGRVMARRAVPRPPAPHPGGPGAPDVDAGDDDVPF